MKGRPEKLRLLVSLSTSSGLPISMMTCDNIDHRKDWPTLQIKILIKIFIVAGSIMSNVYLIMEDDAQHIS